MRRRSKAKTKGELKRDNPSSSRARARQDADKGVMRCVSLMTSGKWVAGLSTGEVASEFGVSVRTVETWATSASRIVRLAIEGDLEDIRARMVATVDVILSRSMGGLVGEEAYVYTPREALASLELKAKILGLLVQKHEVAMSPEEAEQLIAEAKALP